MASGSLSNLVVDEVAECGGRDAAGAADGDGGQAPGPDQVVDRSAVQLGPANGPYVELTAEGEAVGSAVDHRPFHLCLGCGSADGVGQQLGGGPGWRRGVAAFRAVEADDGVEVDGAALLVLGDLGEVTFGSCASVSRTVAPEVSTRMERNYFSFSHEQRT
jgi:hypothetical protein